MKKSQRWWLSLSAIVTMGILLSALTGSVRAQNSVTREGHTSYLPVVVMMPETTPPPIPTTPPLASTSYYYSILTNLSSEGYRLGCELGTTDLNLAGKQDRVVVLDFGTPKLLNGEYGANLLYRSGFANMGQIAEVVKQFGYGYWYCVGADFDSHLRIGIGTNNYTGSLYPAVTYAHGQVWAQTINQVNDWFVNSCNRSCDGQVDAVGANDIEIGWSTAAQAIDWLNGYDSINLYPLYNYGAISGCPYFASPGANCGAGGVIWSKEQVWTLTDSGPVQSLPEIYRNDGVNAQQWYLMSLWAYQNKGKPMDFIGVMTQYGACQQRSDSTCSVLDNTPVQGWTQLHNLINGDPRTRWPLYYSTDIRWLGE